MIVTARSSNAINVQSNTTTEMEVAVNNRSNKRKKVDNTQGRGAESTVITIPERGGGNSIIIICASLIH